MSGVGRHMEVGVSIASNVWIARLGLTRLSALPRFRATVDVAMILLPGRGCTGGFDACWACVYD